MLYFDIITSTHFEFPPMSQDNKQLHSGEVYNYTQTTQYQESFSSEGTWLDTSFTKGKTYFLHDVVTGCPCDFLKYEKIHCSVCGSTELHLCFTLEA